MYPHEEPAHHSNMRIALTWKCVKSHKLLSKKGKNIFYFVSSENHSGTHRFFFEKMHGTLAIFEHQFILLFRHAHVLIFPISIFSWVYTECVCYTLISFHNSTPLIKLMKHYSVERLVFFFPDTAASPSHISCCCWAASGTAWRHTFSFFPPSKTNWLNDADLKTARSVQLKSEDSFVPHSQPTYPLNKKTTGGLLGGCWSSLIFYC